jgi:hypothetical protein
VAFTMQALMASSRAETNNRLTTDTLLSQLLLMRPVDTVGKYFGPFWGMMSGTHRVTQQQVKR